MAFADQFHRRRICRRTSRSGAVTGLAFDADLRPILKATKCDLCVENYGGPACARACPHDALTRMNMNDLAGFADWLRK